MLVATATSVSEATSVGSVSRLIQDGFGPVNLCRTVRLFTGVAGGEGRAETSRNTLSPEPMLTGCVNKFCTCRGVALGMQGLCGELP